MERVVLGLTPVAQSSQDGHPTDGFLGSLKRPVPFRKRKIEREDARKLSLIGSIAAKPETVDKLLMQLAETKRVHFGNLQTPKRSALPAAEVQTCDQHIDEHE